MGNYCLMDTVSVCDDEVVLDMDSGNGYTALRIHSTENALNTTEYCI